MTMVNSTKMLKNFTYIINPLRYMIIHPNLGMAVTLKKGTYHSVIPTRSFKSNMKLLSQEKFTRDPSKIVKRDGTVLRKKTEPKTMINLFVDSEVSVLTMKAAENIAKSKGLNLIKLESKPGSVRETYKLVKDSDLCNDDTKVQSKQDKELKSIIFSSAILDHDIKIKVKSLIKNLLKHKAVMCTIKGAGDSTQVEVMAEKIKQEIKKTDIPLKFTQMKGRNLVTQFKVELVTDNYKELGDNQKNESQEESKR